MFIEQTALVVLLLLSGLLDLLLLLNGGFRSRGLQLKSEEERHPMINTVTRPYIEKMQPAMHRNTSL